MRNSRNARRARWIACGAAAVVLAALVTGSLGAAAAAAPVNTKEPTIAGSPTLGKDLTGDHGTWTGTGITYAYRWLRCTSSCAAIAGATETKYSTRLGGSRRHDPLRGDGDERRREGDRDLERDGAGHERERRPGEHGDPDDLRHRLGGLDARLDDRHVGRRRADHLPVPVAALRQERKRLQEHRRRDERHLQARRRRRQLDDPDQGDGQERTRQVLGDLDADGGSSGSGRGRQEAASRSTSPRFRRASG